jgi:ABC-2 type transport system permease protein
MLAKFRWSPNPIIVKELRSRMRGGRAFMTMTVILLLLGGISYFLFRIVLTQLQYSTAPASPQIGQALFSGLAFLELLMICAVTPAVTATAISGEKEKLTYEMLVSTPLHPANILWGKLVSAMGYVFILIFAAIPMFSLVFTFGGVTVREMVKAVVVLIVVAGMLGVLGLFLSALLGRSSRATVVSYVILAAMLFMPFFIYMGQNMLTQTQPPRWILVISPITSLFSAMQPSLTGQYPMSWFWMFGGFGPEVWFGSPQISTVSIPRPIYHYSLPLFGFISLVLYLITMRLVRPARRWKFSLKDIGITFGILAAYAAAVIFFFYSTTDRYENALTDLLQNEPAPAVVVAEDIEKVVPVLDSVQSKTTLPLSASSAAIPDLAMLSLGRDLLADFDQAQIYALVVRQLAQVDHTFEEAPNFPVIYLSKYLDDAAGSADTIFSSEFFELSTNIMDEISTRLADLPAKIVWIDDPGGIAKNPDTGRVDGDGAVIVLGNIYLEEDLTAYVPGSLEAGLIAAGGRTYLLDSSDGKWQISGTVGAEWIR